MHNRFKQIKGFLIATLVVLATVHQPLFAKSTSVSADSNEQQRYIVIFDDQPLAAYDGRLIQTPERNTKSVQLQATSIRFSGDRKLNVNSSSSKQYLKFLDERFDFFRGEALLRLGRQLKSVHRYRNATNGFATDLTAPEAQSLRDMPGVSSVVPDETHYLETDSGPAWIGAKILHDGDAGFAASGGEGIVIGNIDTGINWDHPSFADPGESGSGWDHVNPYGSQLGLCSDAEVLCNDKLVGVYDFVEDNLNTDVTEENTNGEDNNGHGSHTASTSAGNPVNVILGGALLQLGGVAPNANIISYRVCHIGDPDDPSSAGCDGSAILSAIDRAITDGVDVINHSIGGSAGDPWFAGSASMAFLNARAAGIFVATSAGNEGPNGGSIGSPANAPWMIAVGDASHDRIFASAVENLSGGDSAPPVGLIGASFTDGSSVRKIVHAKDFGNALCGVGVPELHGDCNSSTGLSSPFNPGTFNGEIVVCDRGSYGRVEKGKNVLLAGAGGYILANTEDQWESTVADNHCLPATHLGVSDGDKLRSWLDSGSNHQGSLSDFFVANVTEAGDFVSSSSSRGPNLPPVENILKPDVIAPGAEILAAWSDGSNSYARASGTSMSSPHVAGSAALLKSIHASWTPPMLASALIMTATPELAVDFNGSAATPHKRGAGRPRLDQAVNAGLYLNETKNGFLAANPDQGGDSKDLNLPGLVDAACHNSCQFQRRVTDLAGGASWSASAEGFEEGIAVSITPSNFTLSNGANRLLTININLTGADVVGNWVYGEIKLTSNGLPDMVFTLAVYADGGELPEEWEISSDRASGWKEFALDDLSNMPDATFTSGGLVVPTHTVENLEQDLDNDSPYDNSSGLMTVWHTVPADSLWLHSETLESTAVDLDLFVGLDENGDGIAQESEEICASTSPTEIELCDLFTPVAGDYWIIVQNWKATNDPDEVTLVSAVVGKGASSPLAVSGNGIVPTGEAQKVRLSWDNISAVPGTELIGAVGIGTSRENANNIGVIPVKFTKTGVADPQTLVLMNGLSRGLTLAASGSHDRAFIDVPPGADSLTIRATGATGTQSENLNIELYRVDFDDAFTAAPFVNAPDMSGAALASASGANGNGPEVTVTGGALIPGRWFAVLKNNRGVPAAVDIQADVTFAGAAIPLHVGLWEASSRANLRQGFDYTSTGGYRGFLWYTYDEDGAPAWYLAAAPEPDGNVWVADLLRFTNDGTLQQAAPVGHVSVTILAEEDSIFSFVLYGENGSDREFPSVPSVCPEIDGTQRSYNGVWSRPEVGLGGSTAVVIDNSQAFLHYIYDDKGKPVWLLASPDPQGPTVTEMPLLQFGGYCAVCLTEGITIDTVGMFTREFDSEIAMTWTLDYELIAPLSGLIDRPDDTEKLTARSACQ